MNRIIVPIILAASLLLTAFTDSPQKAPDFKLKKADGTILQLSKLQGNVVLLNFWATWCAPCRREIPDFLEAYEKYKAQGFEIVGVALDEEGWEVVTPFVQRYKITYPVVIGTGKTVQAYGSFDAIPTSFLIDRKGNIVDHHIGLMTKSQLEKKLKLLL
ncbi:MAG: TlpA family protein disulfide reductase [Ignavibacteriales bacterium]|nr:TlpA family protein disulfide reductase [Ignavibacteriales bacterium]